jgi:propionyl-CoA carboxylase alpha chain
MIRVAAGEKLAFGQKDVKLDGWSVETRVYAEDPYRHFLPSTGRLIRYNPPLPRAGGGKEVRVRVDDGVFEGGEVSMFYDPMIAKLITWAPSRELAIDAQIAALDEFEIAGIGHNVDFLSTLMQHPRFRRGDLATDFIADEYPDGFTGAPADDRLLRRLAAIAAALSWKQLHGTRQVSDQLGDGLPDACDWVVVIGGKEHKVTLGEGAVVDGEAIDGTIEWQPGDRFAIASSGDEQLRVRVARTFSGWVLTTHGRRHKVQVLPPHVAELAHHMIEKVPPDLSRFLVAPMPGLLTRLDVKVGQKVEAGQPVAVVEAMKMENILRAAKASKVKATPVKAGDSLAVDQVIVEFE